MSKKSKNYANVEKYMNTVSLAPTIMAQELEKGVNVFGAAVYTAEFLLLTGATPAYVAVRGVLYPARQLIIQYLIIDLEEYKRDRQRGINPLTSYVNAHKKGVEGKEPSRDVDYCFVGSDIFPNLQAVCDKYNVSSMSYKELRDQGVSGETAIMQLKQL